METRFEKSEMTFCIHLSLHRPCLDNWNVWMVCGQHWCGHIDGKSNKLIGNGQMENIENLFRRINNNNHEFEPASFTTCTHSLFRFTRIFISSFLITAAEETNYLNSTSVDVCAINFMIELATKWMRTTVWRHRATSAHAHSCPVLCVLEWAQCSCSPLNWNLFFQKKWQILTMKLHRRCCSSIISSDKLFFSLDKNFAARNELWCFTLEVFVLLLPRAFGSCWSWCPIDVSIVTCTDVRCSLARVCLCMLRAMQIDIYETRISIYIVLSKS